MNFFTVLLCSLIPLSTVSAAAMRQYNIIDAMRSVPIMRALLANGQMSPDNALMESVDGGTPEVVAFLLTEGANPNLVSQSDDDTPLIRAIRFNNLPVVRELLRGGARPDFEDFEGITPMIAACSHGFADAVEALIEAGADVNLQTRLGIAPLHSTTCRRVERDRPSILDMILAADADVNVLDNVNRTPLMVAAVFNNVEVARKLIELHAGVNVVSEEGYNALDYAIIEASDEVAALLMENGARPTRNWQNMQ